MEYDYGGYRLLFYLAAVGISGYAAVTDVKYHKIYNRLTIPAMGLGLLFRLILWGPSGLLDGFLGWMLGAVTAVFWILGMLKAGDIKLYMAIGAIGGVKFCMTSVIASILVGGAVSVCLMAVRKSRRASFFRMKEWFKNLIYTGRFLMYQPGEKQAYFSFGLCIFAGTVLAAFMYREIFTEEISLILSPVGM